MKPRICLIVTVVETADAFMLGQIAALREIYEVTLVTSCLDKDHLRKRGVDVDVQYAPFVRQIAPLRDLRCLFALFRILKQGFHLVHTITPKAGLLGLLAAAIVRVPVRIHTFTGQIWATRRGLLRFLFKSVDRVIAGCATSLLVDSPSQRDFLLKEGVVGEAASSVLGQGSISGVDTQRFRPDLLARERVRRSHGIPLDAIVFAYIGRLNVEKGVLELATAFRELCQTRGPAYLLVVGPDERDFQLRMQGLCVPFVNYVRFAGYTPTPEQYMAAIDVLCLPSHREGFGSTVIEAAACGVPALASRIYGVTDSVIDGSTGLLHEVGNVADIALDMSRLMDNAAWRKSLGMRARSRAETEFSASKITSALLGYYRGALGPAGPNGAPAENRACL